MSRLSRITNGTTFVFVGAAAMLGDWKLREVCWGFWIQGFGVSLLLVAVAVLRCFFTSPSNLARRVAHRPTWMQQPPPLLWLLHFTGACFFGYAIMIGLCLLFWFYGMFLSFFAEMEPLELFGRNGFVNTGIVEPMKHLVVRFWPMIAATGLRQLIIFRQASAWGMVIKPFSREVAPLHALILIMPMIALFFYWALGPSHWEKPAVLAVLALMAFWPVAPLEGSGRLHRHDPDAPGTAPPQSPAS